MKTVVLNGWIARRETWSLCEFFRGNDIEYFSWREQLDGVASTCIKSLDRFLLVGWSMGGSFALNFALDYPEKIAGLVLVAATPRMMEIKPAPGEDGERWAGMGLRRLRAFEEGARMMAGGMFGLAEGRPNPYETEYAEDWHRGIDYLQRTDLRDQLLAIPDASPLRRIPVTIFQSEKDGLVRPDNAAFLKRVFPQAEVFMIPGGEHALPVTIPEQIDDAVEKMAERQ